MSSLVNLLKYVLQLLGIALLFYRDYKVRKEVEREAYLESLEEAYEQQGEAHEIDLKVATGELSPSDLERMRKYERSDP